MGKPKDNIPDFGDQLVVRVGKACNFRCNFCNVSDNERHVELKENVNDIVRNFHYKMKYSNATDKPIEVTISGGEPSIFQKETLFALKYISRFFEKRGIKYAFGIQTNASNISKDFAYKIYHLGIKYALVSFHTVDPDIFKETLGIDYDPYFQRIIDGMYHMQEVGIQVDTNTIMSQENKDNFFDTLKYLENNFPDIGNFNIGVIQPHGEAEKNISKVAPKYEEISETYNNVIAYLHEKNRKVTSHFVGLPACYLDDHSVSLEIQSNSHFRKNFNFDAKYLINGINDENKTQIDQCHHCVYNNICSGIWKKYQGYQVLNPKRYHLAYEQGEVPDFCYILSEKNEDVKKIYSSGVLQLIIPSSLGSKEEIQEIVHTATRIGFYKISLYVDSSYYLEECILYSGITNIQCSIGDISEGFLKKLENFSQLNTPQFRIDIDIAMTTQEKNMFPESSNRYIHPYIID